MLRLPGFFCLYFYKLISLTLEIKIFPVFAGGLSSALESYSGRGTSHSLATVSCNFPSLQLRRRKTPSQTVLKILGGRLVFCLGRVNTKELFKHSDSTSPLPSVEGWTVAGQVQLYVILLAHPSSPESSSKNRKVKICNSHYFLM